MRARVNGEDRELPEGTTVRALLATLLADRPGVAVAVDGRVVPRSVWDEVRLREGCAVEVIRAVGGG